MTKREYRKTSMSDFSKSYGPIFHGKLSVPYMAVVMPAPGLVRFQIDSPFKKICNLYCKLKKFE